MLTISEPGALNRAAILRTIKLTGRVAPRLRRSIEIHLISNRVMQNLNHKFRGLKRPTDVLSFVWSESAARPPQEPLGVLYLAPRYIEEQARRFEVPVREEFTRSLVHGLLHLAGRDHVKIKDAKIMFALQERVVNQFLK